MTPPVLWSFRRCPYAMRARLALASAGVRVELREVVLRDKPDAFLATSPSATVPCLNTGSETLDESLDIMLWALKGHDPEDLLKMPEQGFDLIEENDGPFKTALDRYKYETRYADANSDEERRKAGFFLNKLDHMLTDRAWLFGPGPTLADMAILPFVRQFAHVDPAWFTTRPWPRVIGWLDAFKTSDRFRAIMTKYPQWQPGDVPIRFP